MQKYEIKNYSHLQNIGEISNDAFNLHLKLYEGYVKNTNLLIEKFDFLRTQQNENEEYFGKSVPEFNELHRRFGWEFNGMRLHELFFDSLKVDANLPHLASPKIEEELEQKIVENFGSFDNWKKDFENIAKMRGMGWVMLVQDNLTKRLLNTWVNEHDAGMLSDVKIILNIDMFEHAYIKDFGTDRQKYLNSIFAHIDWNVVSERLS